MNLIDRLRKNAIGLTFGLASLIGTANAQTVNVSTYLPETNLIADGTTIYQMNVRVDSTAFPNAKIAVTEWKVRIPTNTTFMNAQLPTINDFYEGFAMFRNDIDNTIDNGRLNDNARSTENPFDGPSNRIGDLENIYFTVNADAPIGYVEGLFIDINNPGSNPNNFGLFGINFGDTNETLYTITNGNLSISISPFYIRALGDVNFDDVIDGTDIDELRNAINTNSTDLYRNDVDRDGNLNNNDFDYLVNNIIATAFGDATLDRSVDANDLVFVRTSFGQNGGWGTGNFTTDYIVDANDLALVRTNFGFSASYVNNVKPEPSSVGLLGLLGMASFGASAFGRRRLNARGQLTNYDQGMGYGGRDIDEEVYSEKGLEERV